MPECLTQRIDRLSLQRGVGSHLTIVPIVGPSETEPPYAVLGTSDPARVRITEIGDGGSVPVLNVINEQDVRLFLMDGQELLGAKQNRILNTDVLVPSNSSLNIPVSCVEQGRWHKTSAAFKPGGSASHRIRAAKATRVRESLKAERGHDADQGAVWQEVAATIAAAQADAPTHALSEAYTHRARDLALLRSDVTLPDDSVGIAVFQGTDFLGLDIFDRHSTLKYFWTSLSDSYAIDVVDLLPSGSESQQQQPLVTQQILATVAQGQWEAFPVPGDGADWRLDDPRFAASALVWEDRSVIHLQVFPKAKGPPPTAQWRPRIRRPYVPDREQ